MYNSGNSSKNVTGASVVDGTLENADYADNAISGDKIDGGTISNFTSTGVDDNATSTKVTVTDTGLGVGKTPVFTLDVAGSLQVDSTSYLGTIRTTNLQDANNNANAKIVFGGTAKTIVLNTDATNRLSIAQAGDVTVNTGNLVIGTAGKGIDFSAATPDGTGSTGSEVLDDYEEGTWTPAVTSGTVAVGSNKYVKIGKMVYLTAWIGSISDLTSSTEFEVTGIPFTVDTSADNAVSGAVMQRHITYTSGFTSIVSFVSTGTKIRLYELASGTPSYKVVTHSQFVNSSTSIRINFSYRSV